MRLQKHDRSDSTHDYYKRDSKYIPKYQFQQTTAYKKKKFTDWVDVDTRVYYNNINKLRNKEYVNEYFLTVKNDKGRRSKQL